MQRSSLINEKLVFPKNTHWGNKLLLRADSVPSSRQLTEEIFSDIFQGSLSHCDMSRLFGLFYFFCKFYLIFLFSFISFSFSFYHTGHLYTYYSFQLSNFKGFLSVQMDESLFLVLSLGLLFFFSLLLSNFSVFIFLLFYYILFN